MKDEEQRQRRMRARNFVLSTGALLIIAIMLLIFYLNAETLASKTSTIAIILGGMLLMSGLYNLTYLLPRMTKDAEVRVSMEALRASFLMVSIGLVIIFLGVLNLLNVLPHF
ncbi:MAG: hypothetical protein RMJ15_08565 [Nitrososphaerota archaeon]|nr:hypothetical protein [Candidatus Bathyarchaeota archaeon]MDW8023770.1 hypothetical protein [Nitrososphaerota archaeon]